MQIEFTEEGGARIYVGTQSNGQGHETVFARFLSDQTGIPLERIEVVQGDSDRIPTGGGTGGSRSVTTQTNVTLKAVANIVAAFSAYLAEQARRRGHASTTRCSASRARTRRRPCSRWRRWRAPTGARTC